MAKLTAHRLLRIVNEQKGDARPLNLSKWRNELREIRNTLIKLRDRAEDEMDRLEEALREELPQSQADNLEATGEHLEECVDAIAEAINQIDACL